MGKFVVKYFIMADINCFSCNTFINNANFYINLPLIITCILVCTKFFCPNLSYQILSPFC